LIGGGDLPAGQGGESARHQRSLDPAADRELLVEAPTTEDLALEGRPLERDRRLARDGGEEAPVRLAERPRVPPPPEDDRPLRSARRPDDGGEDGAEGSGRRRLTQGGAQALVRVGGMQLVDERCGLGDQRVHGTLRADYGNRAAGGPDRQDRATFG